jgi:hypothetical protein
MLSAAIRARSAFVRRRRPLGPSITSSRETPTPIEPSKWTPILPSLSKSKTSVTRIRAKCPGQLKNGRRGSASRLPSDPQKAKIKLPTKKSDALRLKCPCSNPTGDVLLMDMVQIAKAKLL